MSLSSTDKSWHFMEAIDFPKTFSRMPTNLSFAAASFLDMVISKWILMEYSFPPTSVGGNTDNYINRVSKPEFNIVYCSLTLIIYKQKEKILRKWIERKSLSIHIMLIVDYCFYVHYVIFGGDKKVFLHFLFTYCNRLFTFTEGYSIGIIINLLCIPMHISIKRKSTIS